MKTFKSLLKEITESIEISDDIVSVDGKDRFMLQPAEGHKPKSIGGRAYKYWTIYDIERKKDRKNPAIGMMNKNQAIAYVKKLIKIEKDDPDHPKNMRIVKMHKDDTDTGKHRWDIRTNKGEGDIVDSYGSRTDAHHYLTKFRKEKTNTVNEETERLSFKDFIAERCWPGYKEVKGKKAFAPGSCVKESAAWQRKEGKNPSGGLNQTGVNSYKREHPGSKLQTAVTTKPSKLKAGSKAANRRKSFCARMGGMKDKLTSAKTAKDPDSRINKALRKWNC